MRMFWAWASLGAMIAIVAIVTGHYFIKFVVIL